MDQRKVKTQRKKENRDLYKMSIFDFFKISKRNPTPPTIIDHDVDTFGIFSSEDFDEILPCMILESVGGGFGSRDAKSPPPLFKYDLID